ncbi:DMT family transporter [Ensifer adhaerens]|uniref:DMT family transporter n=1 Tax=Ensifer adhaerens TaxID=106592 RepID=UPI001CBCB38D|nr:DMT family transporter [Ensifer adhaerens]MBZ7926116.1 DMT family transporter [Ensifer adhaerens]UAX97510.1 DMT family transporter [Ensifer adhaerens]UAY03371.1 DMT family transporter [Ensifer adhaerens]UAY11355.1 DMT family transporter [Ensifer adhaerens]
METLFVPLALVAGGLLAVQAGANAQLSKAVGSPFAATTLQLAIGTGLLFFVTLFTGTVAVLAAVPEAEWWHLVGGTASAVYVVSTIVLFPRLGAVVSVGLFIAGQMLASLALDSFGLLGVTQIRLRAGAAIGTLVVLIGVGMIVFGQGGKDNLKADKLGWIALALTAGAVLPVQGAVNALLRHDLGGAPFAVGAVSFFVATLAMAAVMLVGLAGQKAPRPNIGGVQAMPWWGWLGGLAGATYVTTVFTAIPVIGAAAAVGFTVAGQQVASVFVDRYGWFRLPQRPVSGLRLAGVVLLLAGVALIKLV